MQRFDKILIVLDAQMDVNRVAELCFTMALDNNAAITVVDSVPEVSWLARIVGSELDKLRDEAREGVQQRLEGFVNLLTKKGVSAAAKPLDGTSWLAVVAEVREGGYDLVIASGRAEEDEENRFLGRSARRLMRNCPAPLWLIPASSPSGIREVLACVDTGSENPVDSELNDRVYRLAASIAAHHKAQLSVLHAWDMEDERLLRARLRATTVDGYLEEARDYRAHLLERFLRQYGATVEDQNVHLIKGPPACAVSDFCANNDVDLVVIGTVARSGLSGVLIGNTAERILEQIRTPVLTVKPFHLQRTKA